MAEDAQSPKGPTDDSAQVSSSAHQSRPRVKSTTLAPLCVIGVGFGCIDELRDKLDSTNVQWGLVRFQIGSGNFQRTKFVSLCFIGEDCPSMARARLLTRTQQVLKSFGTVHANIEFSNSSELTTESFLQRLLPFFTADDVDISNLHLQYVQWVKGAVEEKKKSMRTCAATQVLPSPAASGTVSLDECRDVTEGAIEVKDHTHAPSTLDEALELVQHGPLNWVVFEALKFELQSMGNGGIEEMQSALDADKVLFGLLRLSFNRVLTKFVVLHWIGSETPPVKRGKGNARLDDARDLIGKKVVIALTSTARSKQDLDPATIISDLQRIHADMDLATMELGGISVEQYLATLAEEQERPTRKEVVDHSFAASDHCSPSASDPSGEILSEDMMRDAHSNEDSPNALPEPADAIGEVCKPDGIYNWVLVGCQKA